MGPALQLVRPPARSERTSSWNLLAQPRRPHAPEAPAEGRQTLWQAAVEAEEKGSVECPLEGVWDDHVHGRLRAWWESVGPDRIILLARVAGGASNVGSEDAAILARVLSGQQQKLLAADFGIAPSTVSGRYVRAVDKLDLTPSTIPLPLVLAAQARVGVGQIPRARHAFFEAQGSVCMVISVPRPNMARMTNLTSAEQEVAAWLIEGCSRFEIARRRKTSVHTVARQFHSIFAVQRVTGRFALIRSAVASNCFAADTLAMPAVLGDERRERRPEEMRMADPPAGA
jgi:DNA-binding CsgD family transcriptional regulator